ncbi:MAG: hypothetical protein ACUVRQ_06270 [Thermoanaerobaculaceae bacterium]
MKTLLPFPEEALVLDAFPNLQELLRNCGQAIARGAFPSTVALLGEPLCGREALAIALAAALICPLGKVGCNCSQCARVRQGLHPDFHVLRVGVGHREIRMEDVTEVLAGFRQVPFEGRKRVYLLTNAHTPPLNVYAASALLKTLEEPVAHAHWLLLAANPLRVLPTIISRAVQLRIPPPPPERVGQLLGRAGAALFRRVPASLGALQEEGEQAEAFLTAARPLIAQALSGDLLAQLRINALAAQGSLRPALLASLAIAEASEADQETAEALLEMAAAYLEAGQLQEQRHLPLEIVATALLGAAQRRF